MLFLPDVSFMNGCEMPRSSLCNELIRYPGLSAFVDLYLALYPVSVLMKLHMSLRKRLALCAALGLGSM